MRGRMLNGTILLVASLSLAACGGGSGGGLGSPAQPVTTATVTGNVAGAAPPAQGVAVRAAKAIPNPTTVTVVDDAGATVDTATVTPTNGNFTVSVPKGKTCVMKFTDANTGKTLGVLTTAAGAKGFNVTADTNLGAVTLNTTTGEATCAADPPATTTVLADADGDGIPNVADSSTDEDGDGTPDTQDAFYFVAGAKADTDADGQPDAAGATAADLSEIAAAGLTPDTDDDNDGLANAVDPVPGVPKKQEVSLKDVPVPEPINLGLFILSGAGTNAAGFPNVDPMAKKSGIALGKALFWSMDLGSETEACASCHFQAGADVRETNTVNPGPLGVFEAVTAPNQTIAAGRFPFFDLATPDDPNSAVVRNLDDIVGSQGVFNTLFTDIVIGSPIELGTPNHDPTFNLGGVNTRQVTGRNTPSAVNAVFNYSNFWDGRGRNIFNGRNPFGELDQKSGVFVQTGGVINPAQELVRIPDASLASQSVEPPCSPVETQFGGRTFAKLAKKVLAPALKPLGRQKVDPTDSVLKDYADTPTGLKTLVPGENAYVTLIRATFNPRYWDAPNQHIEFLGNPAVATVVAGAADPNDTNQFTLMEANFSLFWGLAIQLYEATLVSNDSKFDQVMAKKPSVTFTAEEQDGFGIFKSGAGKCNDCHTMPEFTNHSISALRGGVVPQPPGFLPPGPLVEKRGPGLVDIGFPNIGVTPTDDDVGRGATNQAALINPRTNQPFPLSFAELGLLKAAGQLPEDVAIYVPDLPNGAGSTLAVDGGFKVPTLRNVELNGPFMHNGGKAILQHVVEFYTRGGNFVNAELDDRMGPMGQLRDKPDKQAALVAFLKTLTDDRVRFERAPFDHPQLFIPAGDGLQTDPQPPLGFATGETWIELPAVGAAGRATPLPTFLNLDQVTGQPLP